MNYRTILAGLMVVLAGTVNAAAKDDTYTIMASTDAYNRLVFPVPYQKIVIPPDAEVQEAPVSLKDNMGILIRPSRGAQPISIFVQLVTGEAFTVRMTPSSNPEGTVFRYKGAADIQIKPAKAERPEDGWIADAMVNAAQGKTPLGFETGAALVPIKAIIAPRDPDGRYNADKLNRIDLTPVNNWVGSGYRLKVFRLSAKSPINIEPRDFYRDGVIAVAIDGDIASRNNTPLMVLLEVDNGR